MTGQPSLHRPSSGPLVLAHTAWRELLRGGTPHALDPDATAAALVRRWHQHFAVAIDGPIEQGGTGAERLPELVHAWLDLARRTAPVREYVAQHAGPHCAAEQQRQAALLTRLLAEDLALIGVEAPERRAAELGHELSVVAAAEDRAGRRLAASRAALLRSVGLDQRRPAGSCVLHRVAGWLRPSPTV